MKYYKVLFEGYDYYIEINVDNLATRQITFDNFGESKTSNIDYCLMEGHFFVDEHMTEITRKSFEKLWEKETLHYKHIYESFKTAHQIGDVLSAKVIDFYPQGIRILIDETYFGVKEKMPNDTNRGVNDFLSVKVVDFDDHNLWIIVSEH